jgi:hypothetical protein
VGAPVPYLCLCPIYACALSMPVPVPVRIPIRQCLCLCLSLCARTLMSVWLGVRADYVVVGSDTGRLVILEYRPAKNEFHKVHEETFGKSGMRRIVPGQMLAADPKGRAIMVGMWPHAQTDKERERDVARPTHIHMHMHIHMHTCIHTTLLT